MLLSVRRIMPAKSAAHIVIQRPEWAFHAIIFIEESYIQEPTKFYLYPWRHFCLTEDINILNIYLVPCSSNYDLLCAVERIGEIFGIPKRWISLFQRAMHVADILSYCVELCLGWIVSCVEKRGRGARTRKKKWGGEGRGWGGWGRFLSPSDWLGSPWVPVGWINNLCVYQVISHILRQTAIGNKDVCAIFDSVLLE